MSDDKRRERLRFRSWHRGTREMDLLLGSFADKHIAAFSPEQLGLYEAILEEGDPDIYAWMTGAQPLPQSLDNDVTRLLIGHQFKV